MVQPVFIQSMAPTGFPIEKMTFYRNIYSWTFNRIKYIFLQLFTITTFLRINNLLHTVSHKVCLKSKLRQENEKWAEP